MVSQGHQRSSRSDPIIIWAMPNAHGHYLGRNRAHQGDIHSFTQNLVKAEYNTIFKSLQNLTLVVHVNSINPGLPSNQPWNQEMLFSSYLFPSFSSCCGRRKPVAAQNTTTKTIPQTQLDERKLASCLFFFSFFFFPLPIHLWEKLRIGFCCVCVCVFVPWTWLKPGLSWKSWLFLSCLTQSDWGTLHPISVFGPHPISWCSCFASPLGSLWIVWPCSLTNRDFWEVLPRVVSELIFKGPCQVFKGVTIARIPTGWALAGCCSQLAHIHSRDGCVSVVFCVCSWPNFPGWKAA